MSAADTTTSLLKLAGQGDKAALDGLFTRVYDALRGVAHGQRRRAIGAGSLTTTALVHEAYLRLIDAKQATWSDRVHFFAIASRAMRFILVDEARARSAKKRGGHARAVDLDQVPLASDDRSLDLLAVHDALDQLARHDQRLGDVVQYRFFGGMELTQIAEVLGVSVPTVKRDWSRAQTWLYRFMSDAEPAEESASAPRGSAGSSS